MIVLSRSTEASPDKLFVDTMLDKNEKGRSTRIKELTPTLVSFRAAAIRSLNEMKPTCSTQRPSASDCSNSFNNAASIFEA